VPDSRVVYVDVNGQRFPIRTTLEQRYVHELAAYVDRKMRLAGEASPSSDTVGLAVLTALNIADEVFRARAAQNVSDGSFTQRAEALEKIVDEALTIVGE
jgi:cell division protein ZapA